MNDQRGLVISNPIKVSKTFVGGSTNLDPQKLRMSLIFWDNLYFPSNSCFFIDADDDGSYLISVGVLNRTHIMVSGELSPDTHRRCHVEAFRMLDRREPGVWSLATGDRSITFLDEDMEEGRGVLVRLHRAIPIPDKDVPLQDVLEFRASRRDELLALRHHLEQVYQRVVNAGDGALAWNSEVGALERAIADHMKAAKASGLAFRWSGLDANLNLVPGVMAAATTYANGLTPLQSLMAGGAASLATLSLNVAAAWKDGRAQPTPFRYVSRYHDELFVSP